MSKLKSECVITDLEVANAIITALQLELHGTRETLQDIAETRASCDGYDVQDAEQAVAMLALFRLTYVDAGIIAIGLHAARRRERASVQVELDELRATVAAEVERKRLKAEAQAAQKVIDDANSRDWMTVHDAVRLAGPELDKIHGEARARAATLTDEKIDEIIERLVDAREAHRPAWGEGRLVYFTDPALVSKNTQIKR